MKTIRQRLIGLNLALLLILCLVLSASAQALQDPEAEILMQTDGQAHSELAQKMAAQPGFNLPEPFGQDISLQEDNAAFRISVDGCSAFLSTTDMSGSGWQYDAENQKLVLQNYSGGPIIASGSLSVLVYDYNTITGLDQDLSRGTTAVPAIYLSGELELYVYGSLTIRGGFGVAEMASGIAANYVYVFVGSNASMTVYGGNANASGELAGNAVYAGYAQLRGSNIKLFGGDNPNGFGGCGILASDIDLYANCYIQGGSGSLDGYGVYSYRRLYFGRYFITIYGNPPFAYEEGGSASRASHTVISTRGTQYWLDVEPAQYTLHLSGQGGKYANGATFTNLTAYYPTGYDLSEYSFTRSGYVQTSWTDGTNSYPLNRWYWPTANTRLYAQWMAVQNGDIVLNGLSGTFSDGTCAQKVQNRPVALPDDLTYSGNSTVLGWTAAVQTETDEQHCFSGLWLSNGTTVLPSDDSYTVIYAQSTGSGQYARLHTTAGRAKTGGNLLVYGTTATPLNLEVYLPGGEVLTAPEDYEFGGWATTPGGEAVYQADSLLNLPRGTLVDLYAVWKPVTFSTTLPNGMTASIQKDSPVLEVSGETEAAYTAMALYDPQGKLLLLDYAKVENGTLFMSLSVKGIEAEQIGSMELFTLDDDQVPTDNSLTIPADPALIDRIAQIMPLG